MSRWADVFERIENGSIPEPNSGCLLWIKNINNNGYGMVNYNGKRYLAHRLNYELTKSPIPDGLELDHLCRTPNCINPDHLEPVTHEINMKRSSHATKTHCKNGDELTEDNIYHYSHPKHNETGRYCRKCRLSTLRRFHNKRNDKIDPLTNNGGINVAVNN